LTRSLLFQIHWFLGITVGLVLALMGVTGASLSFEDEISEALSPRLYAPGAPEKPDLSPDQVIARVQADHPGYYVSRLDWQMPRARSHSVRLNAVEGRGRLQGQVDRATGRWLGEPGSTPFFATMDALHRWLALPGDGNGIGRQITGFSALALVFFALSGLYLRWPRRALDWREWLVLDFRKTGRNLWRALHAVIGTWVLVFYLLSALTGLWWSYDWYRRGVTYALTGKADGEEEPDKKALGIALRPSFDPAWARFRRDTGDRYAWVRITQPAPRLPMKAIRFDARAADARHLRQIDTFRYDPNTARLKKRDLYDRLPLGTIVTQSMFEIHRGAFFSLPGRIVMLLTSVTMPLFTITGYMLYLSRRRRKRAAKALAAGEPLPHGTPGILIAYASQTGTAELKARNAALALSQGGVPAQVLRIGKLTSDVLATASSMLFVVSTYGDSEPPDMARGFTSRLLRGEAMDLSHLSYGVLALGDREYPGFCAYGEAVEAWLARAGATSLFPLIRMDHRDAEAEHAWSAALQALGASEATRRQGDIRFEPWTLVSREELNPGSAHLKAFCLRLQPLSEPVPWEPGDIVEVQPCNAPEAIDTLLATRRPGAGLLEATPHLRALLAGAVLPDTGRPITPEQAATLRPLPPREYSAASIAADGTLDLVVRQVRGVGGALGIGSGWLTAHMPVGSTTLLRVRPNPSFRIASDGRPLILIGNGTGIAGLRAHLRAQAHAGHKGHWLLFGERTRAHESFFEDELEAWRADGTLARIDRAFSRDADCGRYVQHVLRGASTELPEWIDRGAIVLVCGSLNGMAQAVHETLAELLGEEQLGLLAEDGRYKRDVY
jgi:sulfite reductase (NADPH) flavoprotein alpha-component